MINNPPILDLAAWRAAYPEFADTTLYPDAMINTRWPISYNFVSDYGWCDYDMDLILSLQWLVLAHLMRLFKTINQPSNKKSGSGGVVTAATIDKVSVTMMPPPVQSEWEWWLMQTPYGQELLALLQGLQPGGQYAGGMPERSAFRKVAGTFASTVRRRC